MKEKNKKKNMQKTHIWLCTYQIELKSVQILLFLLELTEALINFIICKPESPPGNNSNNSFLLSFFKIILNLTITFIMFVHDGSRRKLKERMQSY